MKWYQRTWVAILFLFLFAPVGIFLMWKYHRWNKPVKILLTVFFSFIFISVLIPTDDSQPADDQLAEAFMEQQIDANDESIMSAEGSAEGLQTAITSDSDTGDESFTDTISLDSFKVTRVVDGDTIEIDYNGQKEKVRLIGIDTPENVHPDASKNTEFGNIASDFTKSHLLDKTIKLEFDVSERDQYGRLLAYVWLGDILFNEYLVESGYANVATYPPDVKYVDRFTTAQEKAREANAGLWGYESQETVEVAAQAPSQSSSSSSGGGSNTNIYNTPEQQNTTSYVLNTSTKKFHEPHCYSVKKIKPSNYSTIDSRDDAISRGYVPCKNCNP